MECYITKGLMGPEHAIISFKQGHLKALRDQWKTATVNHIRIKSDKWRLQRLIISYRAFSFHTYDSKIWLCIGECIGKSCKHHYSLQKNLFHYQPPINIWWLLIDHSIQNIFQLLGHFIFLVELNSSLLKFKELPGISLWAPTGSHFSRTD